MIEPRGLVESCTWNLLLVRAANLPLNVTTPLYLSSGWMGRTDLNSTLNHALKLIKTINTLQNSLKTR